MLQNNKNQMNDNDLSKYSRDELYRIAKENYGYKGSYIKKKKDFFIKLIKEKGTNLSVDELSRNTLKRLAIDKGLPQKGFGNYSNQFFKEFIQGKIKTEQLRDSNNKKIQYDYKGILSSEYGISRDFMRKYKSADLAKIVKSLIKNGIKMHIQVALRRINPITPRQAENRNDVIVINGIHYILDDNTVLLDPIIILFDSNDGNINIT
jgi:hypothetical protein